MSKIDTCKIVFDIIVYWYDRSLGGWRASFRTTNNRLNADATAFFLLRYNILLVNETNNPLHLNVVDRCLRRMGDETIPDEAPPSLESFHLSFADIPHQGVVENFNL